MQKDLSASQAKAQVHQTQYQGHHNLESATRRTPMNSPRANLHQQTATGAKSAQRPQCRQTTQIRPGEEGRHDRKEGRFLYIHTTPFPFPPTAFPLPPTYTSSAPSYICRVPSTTTTIHLLPKQPFLSFQFTVH